jgi:hypothetical protein
VQSLTTSLFSGATAIASVLLDNVIISSNFTVQNTTNPGTISSPEVAIPVADGGYIYYLRAGQS